MDVDFTYRPGENLPYAALARIRAAGPVFWSETLQAWAVTSYAAVQEVLSDLDRFTSAGTPVEESLGPEGMLLNDTGLHNKMRAVWTKAMARGTISARALELEALARSMLEPTRARWEAGASIDVVPLIQNYALRFVSSIFAIPEERLDVIRHWNQLSADAPVLELEDEGASRERHLEAKRGVYDLVNEAVADRRERISRGEQPADLVALMTAAEGRHGLTPAMISDNLFNLIIGTDTTERWIANAIVRLAANHDLRRCLRDQPEQIEPMLQEVMRIETVAQVIMRRVKAPGAKLFGKELKGGDQVVLMLGAANGDPAAYDDPEAFDVARPAKQHLGFGYGFHHCLGINIARQEAIAFVKVLLEVLPDFHVANCDYGATWALWGPRRLELAPQA